MFKLKPNHTSIFGMVHVEATPGSPDYGDNPQAIIDKAVSEAKIYAKAGLDGVIIENMHDVPYLKSNVGHEASSMMSVVGYAIKKEVGITCGIQILAGANKAALASALAAGLDFVRAEGFVFAHVADEGLIESDAGELLRYRNQIGASHIPIFTDIKKKHSAHAITADVDLLETAKAAAFFKSSGVIITGKSTAEAANLEEVKKLSEVLDIPVIVGSGITKDNVKAYAELANALIIGSYFKKNGQWQNEIDSGKVEALMQAVK